MGRTSIPSISCPDHITLPEVTMSQTVLAYGSLSFPMRINRDWRFRYENRMCRESTEVGAGASRSDGRTEESKLRYSG